MKNSQSFSLFFFPPPPPPQKRRTLSLLNVATPKQGMLPYRYRHFEHSVLKFEYLLFVIFFVIFVLYGRSLAQNSSLLHPLSKEQNLLYVKMVSNTK